MPVLPASSQGAGLQPSEVSEAPMALSRVAEAHILPSLLSPLLHNPLWLLVSSPNRFWLLVPSIWDWGQLLLTSTFLLLTSLFNFFHRGISANGRQEPPEYFSAMLVSSGMVCVCNLLCGGILNSGFIRRLQPASA